MLSHENRDIRYLRDRGMVFIFSILKKRNTVRKWQRTITRSASARTTELSLPGVNMELRDALYEYKKCEKYG